MFSLGYCEIFRNSFLYRTRLAAASEKWEIKIKIQIFEKMSIPGKTRFLPDMSLNVELVLLVSTNVTKTDKIVDRKVGKWERLNLIKKKIPRFRLESFARFCRYSLKITVFTFFLFIVYEVW